MFAYICLGSNDLERSIKFYDAALAPLGLERCNTDGEPDWDGWAGWGTYESGGAKELALWVCSPFNAQAASAGNGTMVALRAKTWQEVDGFYKAALENGGRSEDAPGLRPQYNADFTRPMWLSQTETRLLLCAEDLLRFIHISARWYLLTPLLLFFTTRTAPAARVVTHLLTSYNSTSP